MQPEASIGHLVRKQCQLPEETCNENPRKNLSDEGQQIRSGLPVAAGGKRRTPCPTYELLAKQRVHILTRRSRRALAMTDSELNVMAAAAIMGLSKTPKKG